MDAGNLTTVAETKFDRFLDTFSLKVLIALWCSATLLYIWGPEKVVIRFAFSSAPSLLEGHSHVFLFPAIASALLYFIHLILGFIPGFTGSTVITGKKDILYHKFLRRSLRTLKLAIPFIGFIAQAGSLLFNYGFHNQSSLFVDISLLLTLIPFFFYFIQSFRYL